MAKLVIRLHGKKFMTVDLVDGKQYFAGRDQNCEIPLNNQKGISRSHLKIFQKNEIWIAELVSRYGSLIFEGESAESIQLEKDSTFQVPPYEFSFQESPVTPSVTDHSSKSEQSSVATLSPQSNSRNTTSGNPTIKGQLFPANELQPSTHKRGELITSDMSSNSISREGNLEATAPGISNLSAFLRIKFPDRDRDEVLELVGHLWVAGRDANCEIPIEDGHVSRNHFELSQTNDGMYITDLGSANGTSINGQILTPHEPFKIVSGDHITIMDLTIILEMRDRDFKSKLMVASQIPLPDQPAQMLLPAPFNPNIYFDPEGPSAVRLEAPPPVGFKGFVTSLKKNKVRLALVLSIPLLFLGSLFNSETTKTQKATSSSKEGSSFDRLSPEKKFAVKDIFNLARGHYTQGRYELCVAELIKLHEIIPLYEDSKSLQAHCTQGSEMTRENQELERKERARIETQQKISFIVKDCKSRLGNGASVDEAKECLSLAIELDPSNSGVVSILSEIQAKEDAEKKEQADAFARQSRNKAGESQYRKAKELYKKGRLNESIGEFERFLRGGYPGLQNLENIATRELASTKKELDKKIQTGLSLCKSHYEKKNYRPAIEACDQALSEDPNNKEVRSTRAQVLSDLRREMRAIYEDSAIEESLGEIEGAKEKWKKILQNDIESDEYYQRAKRKLQKYGTGI
jgi:pSer/pThr/pTyr-binding forkhead associated (FHA) protein/tetratricopeptide (TPR) repeat protein